MTSYGNLIYDFVVEYLNIAVECSICRESIEGKDDTDILERSNKLFIHLIEDINTFDSDEESARDGIKKALRNYGSEEFESFVSSIKSHIMSKMILKELSFIEKGEDIGNKVKTCVDYVDSLFFGDEFNKLVVEKKPQRLIEYIRRKEEDYKIG